MIWLESNEFPVGNKVDYKPKNQEITQIQIFEALNQISTQGNSDATKVKHDSTLDIKPIRRFPVGDTCGCRSKIQKNIKSSGFEVIYNSLRGIKSEIVAMKPLVYNMTSWLGNVRGRMLFRTTLHRCMRMMGMLSSWHQRFCLTLCRF